MKYGFASADWSNSFRDDNGHPIMGGSGHARIGQYFGLFPFEEKVLGHLIFNDELGVFGVADWNGKNHFDCDVVYMQRYMNQGIANHISRAQSTGQIIINDIDDWYWGLDPANQAHAATDPKKNPKSNRDHYRDIIRASDLIIVSTPFLKKKMEKWNDNVVLLGNYVETEKFLPPIHDVYLPCIGWVGSTNHRSGDLETLRGVLTQLRGTARFHHTGHFEGSTTFAYRVGLKDSEVTRMGFLPAFQYQFGFPFQIGIAPLSDQPFNHAKSSIKAMEYAAAGIPAVLSNLPEYRKLHEETGIGFLAGKPSHWVNHLKTLCLDVDMRKEKSEKDLAAIKEKDVQIGLAKFVEILESCWVY